MRSPRSSCSRMPRAPSASTISGTGRPQPAIRLRMTTKGSCSGSKGSGFSDEDAAPARRRRRGSSGGWRRRRRAASRVTSPTPRAVALGQEVGRRAGRASGRPGRSGPGGSAGGAGGRSGPRRPRRGRVGAASPCRRSALTAAASTSGAGPSSRSVDRQRLAVLRLRRASRWPGSSPSTTRAPAHRARRPTARCPRTSAPAAITRPGPTTERTTRAPRIDAGLGMDEPTPAGLPGTRDASSECCEARYSDGLPISYHAASHAHAEQRLALPRPAARRGRARCPTGPGAGGRAARDRARARR